MGIDNKLRTDSEERMKIIALGFVAILFFMFSSYSQQEAEWKGTIEEVDGITVVKNPKEPMYEKDVLVLEEELTIGDAGGREEYMFQQVRHIAVDEKENIYILDRKAGHIKVFNKKGSYIQTIGKKGQGPGEFVTPGQIFIRDRELMVYDDGDRSFSFFTLDGEFIKSINASKAEGLEVKIDSKGNITFATMGYSNETRYITYRLDLYDQELNFIKRLNSIPDTTDQRGYNLFPPLFSWAIDSNDNIVYGYQKEYRLQVFDPDGNLKKVITKEHEPTKITKQEIDERMANIQPGRKVYIPQCHPIFRIISIDEDGHIYVMNWPKAEDHGGYFFDVFDSVGRYIAKISLMGLPRVWKNGKLYTIEEDEEGYQYIKRYKIIWNY